MLNIYKYYDDYESLPGIENYKQKLISTGKLADMLDYVEFSGERWPEAEPYIMRDTNEWKKYKKRFGQELDEKDVIIRHFKEALIKCFKSYHLEYFQQSTSFDIAIDYGEDDEYWGAINFDSPEDGYVTAITDTQDGDSIEVISMYISDDLNKHEDDVERIVYQLLRVMRKNQ